VSEAEQGGLGVNGIGRKVATGVAALTALLGGVLLTASGPVSAMPLPNVALAWGNNASGQLGNGSTTSSSSPDLVGGVSGISQLATGDHFALALLSTGNVVAWGQNDHGQLGDGTTTDRHSPVAVSGLPAGEVRAVAAGGHHSLALLKNGMVVAWGDNSNGQLGNGTTTDSSVPVNVSGVSGVYQIQAGEAFSTAVVPYGTVYAWGANAHGQLGNGTTTDSDVPVEVTAIANEVRLVSAGSDFVLALMGNKDVDSWGDNTHGQLGNGTTTDSDVPVPVSGLTFVHTIAAGGGHSIAVLSLGNVATWGDNTHGQLGNGTTTDSDVPVTLSMSNAYLLAAGGQHSVVLMRNGTVEAFGDNSSGQLGDGTIIQRDTPTVVHGLTGVTAVSAGSDFTVDKGVNLAPKITSRSRLLGFPSLPLVLNVRVHSHPSVATIGEIGTLPSGLSFVDNGNDTATLSGTPATGSEGVYRVQITATTGVGGTATQNLRILIK